MILSMVSLENLIGNRPRVSGCLPSSTSKFKLLAYDLYDPKIGPSSLRLSDCDPPKLTL